MRNYVTTKTCHIYNYYCTRQIAKELSSRMCRNKNQKASKVNMCTYIYIHKINTYLDTKRSRKSLQQIVNAAGKDESFACNRHECIFPLESARNGQRAYSSSSSKFQCSEEHFYFFFFFLYICINICIL